MSDSKIVKELANAIRKAQRRGPKHFRKPPVAHEMHTGRMISNGHNSFSIYQIEKQLADEDYEDHEGRYKMYLGTVAGMHNRRKLANRILKRALKKAAQPHRTNHNRHKMRRKAAGKNEVCSR